LNVISIQLPPLRERKEDIQLLVEHYVKKFGKRVGKTIHVSPEVLSFLKKYPWAGNVRELKNVMERMVLFCEGKTLQLSDLPPEIRNYTIEEKEVPLFESFHDPQYVWGKGLLRLEKEVGSKLKVVLEQFIERCEGDEGIQSMEDFILRACYVFGDSKSTFYDYLKKYQLEEKRIELSRSLRQK